jgi:hypothetical protein
LQRKAKRDAVKYETPRHRITKTHDGEIYNAAEENFRDYYNKKTRTYRKEGIGEVKLPKVDYYLVDPERSKGSIYRSVSKVTVTPRPRLESQQAKELDLQCSYKPLDCIRFKTPYSRPYSRQFIQACKSNNVREIERLLLLEKRLIGVMDKLQLTGLHWAALRGLPHVVALLIARGSKINAVDIVRDRQSNRTPLVLALKSGNAQVVKLLLNAKADPYITTSSNKLPMSFAKNEDCEKQMKKAMMVRYSQTSSLKWLSASKLGPSKPIEA